MPRQVTYDELAAALRVQEPAAEPAPDATALLAQLARAVADAAEPDRGALRTACRALAQELAARVPGRSVELRVPPYAAVQCVPGPRHTRGTPGSVVEVEPHAWVQLATGRVTWSEASADGRVSASGERSDLSAHLPLVRGGTAPLL